MAIKGDENNTPVFPGGIPLQVALWTAQRAFVNFTGASARVVLPAGSEIVELTATENCYIAFGDVTVAADTVIANDASRLFLAGVQAIVVPLDANGAPYTYVAALEAVGAVNGILQAEKLG